MTDCIFCKIVAGELPCYRVFETEDVLAFLDIRPATRGHTLVVPKRHCRDLFDATEAELAAVVSVAQRIGATARSVLQAPGVSLRQASGQAAGQDVFHLHFHVLPRYVGDNLHASWGKAEWRAPELNAERQAAIASELLAALS